MRQIKFRGRDAVGGKGWVYGDLVHNKKVTRTGLEPRVMVGGYEVDEESIGQYVGLKDKNGKEIYEGDIIAVAGVSHQRIEVRFVRGVFAFLWNGDLDDECPCNAPTYEWAEVVGNIYDNPELIKQQ